MLGTCYCSTFASDLELSENPLATKPPTGVNASPRAIRAIQQVPERSQAAGVDKECGPGFKPIKHAADPAWEIRKLKNMLERVMSPWIRRSRSFAEPQVIIIHSAL